MASLKALQEKITEEQCKNVERRLDEIVGAKLNALNPNFSDSIISKMLCSIHRGNIIIPREITVIDNNAVFVKEDILDDFGQLHKTSLLLVDDDAKEGFKEVENVIDFTQNHWEKDCSDIFGIKPYEQDRDGIICTIKHITDSINNLLKLKLEGKNVGDVAVFPTSDLNTDKIFYGYDGISYKISGLMVFLDHNLNQICEAMHDGNPTLIKMIATEGMDEFYYYEIVQYMINGVPTWIGEEKNIPIWKLSEALNPNKKVDENREPILSKIRVKR